MAALGSFTYGLCALCILYAIGKRYFSAPIAFLGTFSVWLATPLIYYMTIEPLMAHAVSVFWVTLFIGLWLWARSTSRLLPWGSLGVIGGLAAITHYQNALTLLLPLWDILFGPAAVGRKRWLRYGQNVLYWIGALAVILLQAYANYSLRATLWETGYATESPVDFFSPQLFTSLWGWPHGLFLFSPITFCALVGLMLWSGPHRHVGHLLYE